MTYKYQYLITFIGTDDEPAYEAVIPAFGGAIIFGDSLEELTDGIDGFIEGEIEVLKKAGKPIPVPEVDVKVSGKIALRIQPILHHQLILEAKANKTSLNKYIESKLKG